LVGYLDGAVNDLEAPASRLVPDIEDASFRRSTAKPGCVLAQMSGSGATCFRTVRSAAIRHRRRRTHRARSSGMVGES
jgi:4-diphosphocytidyl-2C-methyl-D-erythritol kinase